jgi:SAM-dependent methyltransferase
MRREHLPLLACPGCSGDYTMSAVREHHASHVMEATLRCSECASEIPVTGGVPRFVPRENYASGFGLEWSRHARTQYDSYSGIPASENRFFGQTRWPRRLDGELILEVGSGSGRFTEQAASTRATVVSVDYSYAVDANFASNQHLSNVLIVQADVYAMPFRDGTFDRLFCFGMLQHTPDPRRAFASLVPMVKPGGSIVADVYKLAFFRSFLQTKYYVRPLTRRMDPERLYRWVRRWIDFMWPVSAVVRRLPKGYAINWRLLVADYSFLGLSGQMLKEWAYLDTFDMLAPRYDRPQRLKTFRRWFEQSGLAGIEVEYTPHGVVGRGERPAVDASRAPSAA